MKWLLKLFSGHKNECKIDGGELFIFWDGTQHYHAWSVNGNEQYVWQKVKAAIQKDNGHRTDLILTNGNAYTFVEVEKFSSYSDTTIMKTVELYYNKSIVSCFVLELRHEDFELSSVEFINEGEWQKDIVDFLVWKKGNDELMRRNIEEMMERSRREKMSKALDS